MKAVLRFGVAAFAVGLLPGAAPALAQSTAQPVTNTPATESIGPRELQNFSLNGTVTRPAETPPPATRPRTGQQPPPPAGSVTASAAPPSTASRPQTIEQAPSAAGAGPAPRAGQSLSLDLPPAGADSSGLSAGPPQPGFAPEADSAPPPLAPQQKVWPWPWLLLAAVLGSGAAFLLWRRRSREAVAGGPLADAYATPEPTPQLSQPGPFPLAPPADAAPPAGIVSTRLRPWVDLAFAPLGCVVDEEQVTIEFEVQLYNSGGAPARDILVEASLFNAGPTQDQDIGAFFAKPAGEGERIQSLPPLQRMTIRSALVAPRANIQQFELGGRQVFVPLVAFNALYRWGGGKGQTSLGYLLGRETTGEKLGPIRADLGPRTFTGLAVRPLPAEIRK